MTGHPRPPRPAGSHATGGEPPPARADGAGLTTAQVARRVAAGQANTTPVRDARPVVHILRANLLTRFNVIIGVLAGLVLVFGSYLDSLFGLVVVVNSAIGISQELRARRTLRRLAILARAPVRVRRDGRDLQVEPEQVVRDDLVLLGIGDTVPVDGQVAADDGLEVDESLLTGEPDPVPKPVGAPLRSGSFVTAGSGGFIATRVGADSYAAGLAAEASAFSLADSELYQGINRFLRLLTWVIVPVGGLLVVRQLTSDLPLPEAVVGSVAGLAPMIPEGLVLITSVAFAVGVIRLGRRRCLVQELPAVETLARVDVLCLDKTGTLTEPGLELTRLLPVGGGDQQHLRRVLAALVAADPRPNPTMRAISQQAGPAPSWPVQARIAFSSARGYSAVSFEGEGTWFLGAPDVLLAGTDPLAGDAAVLAGQGLRVLALATARSLESPQRASAALVVLEQHLRPESAGTLRFFAAQRVSVKVLSGDNPASVGAVAAKLGIPGADRPADARQLPEDSAGLAAAMQEHPVIGRVNPHRKRALVAALQSQGHTVAMTGDGVNDTLALKQADLGVAMGTGNPAARAVAKIVLLSNDFATLPWVVAEGRRVLANIERVANLFLTKTVYAVILAVVIGLAQLPYPLLPRHITLVASLTIGIPSFLLALAPSDERARSGFVPRVLRFAVPAGLVCATASFTAYLLARGDPAGGLRQERSVATICLFLAALFVLALVARPLAPWKLAMLGATAAAFALVLTVPAARDVADLSLPDPRNTLVIAVVTLAAVGTLYILLRRTAWIPAPSRS